jgi:DnaJ family protein C protein 3
VNQIHARLSKAQRLLKLARQKDYYKVLGVSRDADEKTIKKA